MYTVLRTKGLSTFPTLCAISDNISNPTYLSLGHFIGEPLTHYLPLAKVMSVSIFFHAANVPTTDTEVLAELIN